MRRCGGGVTELGGWGVEGHLSGSLCSVAEEKMRKVHQFGAET